MPPPRWSVRREINQQPTAAMATIAMTAGEFLDA